MYCSLKSNEEYAVYLKDCSFGGKYPVVALIIIEKNTGKYGVRFGCHPDYGVAIERTFTEATQGQNIEEFAKMNQIDFDNRNVNEWDNILNSFKVGLSQYPYQFLLESSAYKFVEPKDVSGKNNKEILNEWVGRIITAGNDILIREMSSLGFPTFQIIIPGLSELKPMSTEYAKLYNTKIFSILKLRDLRNITLKDCGYIAATIRRFKDCILENNIESYFPNCSAIHMPGEDVRKGTEYLAILCHLARKEYEKAEFYAVRIVNACNYIEISEDRKHMYKAILFYCQIMKKKNSHKDAIEYLRKFFDKYICNKIDFIFENSENILYKQYSNMRTNKFSSIDNIKEYHLCKLSDMKKRNPIDQRCIGEIFENIH